METPGIDVSAKSIASAVNSNITNALFQLYDELSIPYKNGSFNLVFIAAVLHHIEF